MDTLNPTLWLTDPEVQVEINRIAEQSKTKIAVKPTDVADFTLSAMSKQVDIKKDSGAAKITIDDGCQTSDFRNLAPGRRPQLKYALQAIKLLPRSRPLS